MLSAAVVLMAAIATFAAIGGCALLDTSLWVYRPGTSIDFGNGWAITVPPGWSGQVDLEEPDTNNPVSPVYRPMKMYGPAGTYVYIKRMTTAEARRRVALDVAEAASSTVRPELAMTQTVLDARHRAVPVSISVTFGSGRPLRCALDIYILDRSGPILVALSDDEWCAKAIKRGESPDALVEMVAKRIGLHRVAH